MGLQCAFLPALTGHLSITASFWAPDAEDLFDLLLRVRLSRYDEQSVQEVNGDAVGTTVRGAPDPENGNI